MEQRMESHTVPPEDGIDLKSLFRILYRHARLIIGITIVSAFVAVPISLLLPVYYKAETRIYPPQEKGGALPPSCWARRGD